MRGINQVIINNSLVTNHSMGHLNEIAAQVPFVGNIESLDIKEGNYTVQKLQLSLYEDIYELLVLTKEKSGGSSQKKWAHIKPKMQFQQIIHLLAKIYHEDSLTFNKMLANVESNNVILYLYFIDVTHYCHEFQKYNSMEKSCITSQPAPLNALLNILSLFKQSKDDIFYRLDPELSRKITTLKGSEALEEFEQSYHRIMPAFVDDNSPSYYQDYLKFIYISQLFSGIENKVEAIEHKQKLFYKYFNMLGFKQEKAVPESSYLMFYESLKEKIKKQTLIHGLHQETTTFYSHLNYDISERQLKEFDFLRENLHIFPASEFFFLVGNIEILYLYINQTNIWPLQFFKENNFYKLCANLLLSLDMKDEDMKKQWFHLMDQTVEGLLKYQDCDLLMGLMINTPKLKKKFPDAITTQSSAFIPFFIAANELGLLGRADGREAPYLIGQTSLLSKLEAFSLNMFFSSCASDIVDQDVNPSMNLAKSMHHTQKKALVELLAFLHQFVEYTHLNLDYIKAHSIKKRGHNALLLKDLFSIPDLPEQGSLTETLMTGLKRMMQALLKKTYALKEHEGLHELFDVSMNVLTVMGLSSEKKEALKNYYDDFEIKIKALIPREKSVDEIMAEFEGLSQATSIPSKKSGSTHKKKGKQKGKKKEAPVETLPLSESAISVKEAESCISSSASTSMMMKKIKEQNKEPTPEEQCEDKLKGEFLAVRKITKQNKKSKKQKAKSKKQKAKRK